MNKTWKEIFPWRGEASWDVDVAVVGGGPAGLAATIRLRWLKTFPLVPVSVALINSGPLGGLARLGNSILTGPALAFPAGTLVERLLEDLEKWPTPIIADRVASIKPKNKGFELVFEGGRKLTALAVIMATGMLDLRNLRQFWRQGVAATFGSREKLYEVLGRELRGSRRPIIVGGPQLPAMATRIKALNDAAGFLVLEGNGGKGSVAANHGPEFYRGRLLKVHDEKGRVSGISIMSGGRKQLVETDKVVIDFNSLELANANPVAGLPQNGTGFVPTDAQSGCGTPGLFAAGDCSGPPFSAAVAIGQGVQAGFACYRYVFEKKYGLIPPLFAYYGDPEMAEGPSKPEFTIAEELVPDRLVRELPAAVAGIRKLVNGRNSIGRIIKETGLSPVQVIEAIKKFLKARAITFLSFEKD